MLKLIVIDDEIIIRESLSKFISDEEMGFDVVDSFKDGDEAIEYLKENTVDVVITDIKMTRVSGIAGPD